MKTIAQLIMLFAFASFGLAAEQTRETQIDDIREAVFRWQFEHSGSGRQRQTKVYFLQVGETEKSDPSDEFMKRFADHKPPVRKVSTCKFDVGKGVLDAKTAKEGVIFRATSIEWKSDAEVDVEGGYDETNFSASGNTYTLKKEKGKWKVTNDKMHWVS